jgi:hypothetical protein
MRAGDAIAADMGSNQDLDIGLLVDDVATVIGGEPQPMAAAAPREDLHWSFLAGAQALLPAMQVFAV